MERLLTMDNTKPAEEKGRQKATKQDDLNEIVMLTEPSTVDQSQIERGVQRMIFLHSHTFYEMIYVLSGEGIHIINSTTCRMKRGDVFLLPPGVSHRYDPVDGCRDLRICNIIFQQIPNASFTMSENYMATSLSKAGRTRFESFLQNMEEELRHRAHGYQENMRSYCSLLLSELSRSVNEHHADEGHQDKLNLVLAHIEENYATTTFQECVELSAYSPAYFCRLFKKVTGMNFGNYINHKKIAAAAKLLLETDAPIESIANQVHLQNGNHFYSLFKRQIGMTPKAFRKMRRAARSMLP